MKTCLAMLFIILGVVAPAMAGADAFPRYAETVWLEVDGTARVDVEVDCRAGTNSPVRIPVETALTGLTIRGVDHATASIVGEGAQRYISIDFPGPLPIPATFRVSGLAHDWFAGITAPPGAFGNRTMTYRFLNSTPAELETVSNQVVLPAGFVVTSIEDSEPPANESSTMPPFAVVSRDGRHTLRIEAAHVGLGGAVSVTFRFKERHVSPLVSITLLAIGAAYLAGFRSLIDRTDDHP
jgi:hypothetical protein